jgi:mono/diheme cytochrome c family protein
MPDYAEQIPPEDRWAIAAYIRALQLSQQTALADAPESEQLRLRESEP